MCNSPEDMNTVTDITFTISRTMIKQFRKIINKMKALCQIKSQIFNTFAIRNEKTGSL